MRKKQETRCESCAFRAVAEKSPKSLRGRLWIWHTSFCPGWKKHLQNLREQNQAAPRIGHLRGIWEK